MSDNYSCGCPSSTGTTIHQPTCPFFGQEAVGRVTFGPLRLTCERTDLPPVGCAECARLRSEVETLTKHNTLLRLARKLTEDEVQSRAAWLKVALEEHERLRTSLEERDRRIAALERPPGFPRIVCLCGSTRFMDYFHEAGWQFTLDGKIVLSVGVAKHVKTKDGGHAAEALGPGVAERLDKLHLRKIELADEVFVLNVDGHIGESTRREIDYARSIGKPITFLEPEAARVLEGGG